MCPFVEAEEETTLSHIYDLQGNHDNGKKNLIELFCYLFNPNFLQGLDRGTL